MWLGGRYLQRTIVQIGLFITVVLFQIRISNQIA